MANKKTAGLIFAMSLLLLTSSHSVFAQGDEAGKIHFDTTCARCHGGESGPTITSVIAH